MPYNPPNPNFPMFQMKIGGKIYEPERPNYLVSFSYQFAGSGNSSSVSIQVFDRNWHDVENDFTKNRDEIFVRWGYVTQMTGWHQVIITEFIPSFQPAGMAIQIAGQGFAAVAASEKKKDTYVNMTPTEVVKVVAGRNGWKLDSEETDPIYDYNDIASMVSTKKTWHQNEMSDFKFLKEVVLPQSNAATKGFTLWFDESSNTLHFHPPRIEKKEIDQYIVMRDRMGVVAAFSPTIEGLQILGALGSMGVQTRGVDPVTGKPIKHDSNNQTTQKVNMSDRDNAPPKTSPGGSPQVVMSTAPNQKALTGQAEQRYVTAANMTYKATLEVLGDPTKDMSCISQNIEVILVLDNANIHYLSGKFTILGFTHTISAGRYTTVLDLVKNAASSGEIKPIGKVAA